MKKEYDGRNTVCIFFFIFRYIKYKILKYKKLLFFCKSVLESIFRIYIYIIYVTYKFNINDYNDF